MRDEHFSVKSYRGLWGARARGRLSWDKDPYFPGKSVTLWRLSVLQHWVVMESVFYTTGKPLPLAAICSPFIPLEELDLEQLTELNKYVGNTLQ